MSSRARLNFVEYIKAWYLGILLIGASIVFSGPEALSAKEIGSLASSHAASYLGAAIPTKAQGYPYTGAQPASEAAAKPVTFVSGQPAIAAGLPTAANTKFSAPGIVLANLPPVSGASWEQSHASAQLPQNINQAIGKTNAAKQVEANRIAGDTSPAGPPSIALLARALNFSPDVIFQWVHNNVEPYPIFGAQKGSVGAVLDNQGTTYDQAMLMVDLLRASGYTASFTTGVIKVTAAQLNAWYGVDTSNACAVLTLLGRGQIPVYAVNATVGGTCPGNVGALVDISVGHVWVKTVLNGTTYYFDPSFKTHTFKTGIDLGNSSITGYNAATYLSSAKSGATITSNYVQNINASFEFVVGGFGGSRAGVSLAQRTLAARSPSKMSHG
jgi:hypothetical protein